MLESQTATEETSSVSESSDVNTEESSTAESSTEVKGVEQNKSMLDAVKEALAGSDKSPKSELTPETTEGTVAKATGEDGQPLKDGEIPPEEMKQFSRGAQYRIRQLTASKKVSEDRIRELEPAQQVFERLTSVMQRHQLSEQEFDDGVEIMGAMKTSPDKALELLAPIVRKLLAATGHQLPDDLKAKVEAGALSEADARELSTARSRATHLTARAEQDEQQREQEAVNRERKTNIDNVTKTADAWHAEKATTDPDWHLKQDRVVQLVELQVLRTKKFPQSDKEARSLFDEALKTVEAELKHFIPKKAAIKPANGNASPSAKPEPKTMLEAMRQAVNQ